MKEFLNPKVRVIIQARTDSTRLPGKALLPIFGIPSAALVALRAGVRNHDIIVATTRRKVDDNLAETVASYGLKVYRGDTNDVRSRFLCAVEDLVDTDIAVRLTADNLVPDGYLIEEMLALFTELGTNYLNIRAVWKNPPYGLGVEIFRIGALRASARNIDTPFDREHVTPSLRAQADQISLPTLYFSNQESCVRCTMDTLDDYLKINRAFSSFSDPVSVGWYELIKRLACDPDYSFPHPASGPGLVIGTAQLACPYGSVVKVTPPDADEAVKIIRRAISAKVLCIDTARAYPGAESVLGKALRGGWSDQSRIITKLDPLSGLSLDAPSELAAALAEISVMRSLRELGDVKPALLLHRADHLLAWEGAVWSRLNELVSKGLLSKLGVSVQSVAEAKKAIACPQVQLIQIPFNLLDYRWHAERIPELIRNRSGLEVHVRSIFLQGILLREQSQWPLIPNVDCSNILSRLTKLSQELNRECVADLCIAWVRSHDWIQGVVIGIESISQLEQNLKFFSRSPLTTDEAYHVRNSLPKVPDELLNPALWNKINES